MKLSRLGKWTLIGLLLVIIFSTRIAFFFTEWFWYTETGYLTIFTTMLWTRILCGVTVGVVFFIFILISFLLVQRLKSRFPVIVGNNVLQFPGFNTLEPYVKKTGLAIAFLLAILSGYEASTQWDLFLRAVKGYSLGLVDPLFARDIGFYIFKLPLLEYLNNMSFFLVLTTLLFTAGLYLAERNIYYSPQEFSVTSKAKGHLLILLALLLGIKGWGYHLDMYRLLYSTRGIIFGASYTDVYAILPYLKLSIIICILCVCAVVIDIFTKRWRLTVGSLIGLILLSLVGGVIYPEIIQKFVVIPNELNKEKPFISRSIEFTRMAFGLDKIVERNFDAREDLSWVDLKENEATIKNVPLWDHKPLLQAYSGLQEIRTYYDFFDVDNDRYTINGEYRQTMISPRELSYRKLPEKNWINQTFIYTHGYGACLGPANKSTKDGLPEFFIKDIPPVSSEDIKIDRPEIYYGEVSDYDSYCIVKSNMKEFDYPLGSENRYCTYGGTGGISIGPAFMRTIFAIRYREVKMLLSSAITAESRFMMYRNINERIRRIAPFLTFDRDPYMIIAGGKLYWIIDGYTASSRYPYSQPLQGGVNFLRNSVKAVVDAYNGSVKFYISDKTDPIIATYGTIFPGVFEPIENMPANIKAHIRYPAFYFNVQAGVFATYHMTDPQVFYNKEDLWKIPKQTVMDLEEERPSYEEDMRPYYTILKFPRPEGEKEEFIQMIPFTPTQKPNMIAWMASRCDVPNYGKILVYTFPKDKLTFGPVQINDRIDQDTKISEQLTLWGQGGSRVIRGSLLVIPIRDSLLYIEPLYLAAEQGKGKLPQLKKVLVIYGSNMAMEDSLEESIKKVFSAPATPGEERPSGGASVSKEERIKSLIKDLNTHFSEARRLQRDENWAGYGEEMKRVQLYIDELVKIHEGKKEKPGETVGKEKATDTGEKEKPGGKKIKNPLEEPVVK